MRLHSSFRMQSYRNSISLMLSLYEEVLIMDFVFFFYLHFVKKRSNYPHDVGEKVGIKDVAKHAGVSISLVSYVLNGKAVEKQVKKETAEKIIQAAKELNYRPNLIAKSLKISKTNSIGLMVADINYRFSSGITKAVEEEAKKHNYTVIYGSSNESKEGFETLLNVFLERRVDGLIIIAVDESEEQIRSLEAYDIPFILVDRIFSGLHTNYIALDNFRAAYNATEYLIKRGHRHIAFCNYESNFFHLNERDRGYQKALEDYQIPFDPDLLLSIPNNEHSRDENVRNALRPILKPKKGKCDAVFFATDSLTICGLKYIVDANIKVPKDLSVMSFDEHDAYGIFYCPITYSRQPLEEMGKQAVRTLVELMENEGVRKQVTFEAKIVSGKSCRE